MFNLEGALLDPTLPRAIFVRLRPMEALKLRILSREERRRPQDQVAVLLADALAAIPLPGDGDSDGAA